MGSISTSSSTIAFSTKVYPNTSVTKRFRIDADEGTLTILITPSHSRSPDALSVMIDGKPVKVISEFGEYPSWPLTISKVLDNGYHDFLISFKSAIVNHYILYTAALELATTVKTDPAVGVKPPPPISPPTPPPPVPVERGCFLFAIGLIVFRIFMAMF